MGLRGDIRTLVGTCRTVLAAVAAAAPNENHVLIEEAARPFIATAEIDAALRYADLDAEEVLGELVARFPELLTSETLTLEPRLDRARWRRRLAEEAAAAPWDGDGLVRIACLVCATGAVLLSAAAWAGLLVWVLGGLLLLGATAAAVVFGVSALGYERLMFLGGSAQRLRSGAIADFVRRRINERLRELQRDDHVHVGTAAALTDLTDRRHLIATAAVDRLARLSDTMAFGSIGVSGPRGVGKSTLLKGFCDKRFARPEVPELRVLIAAPVDYDARDFLLHAFARLCESILDVSQPDARRSSLLPTRIAATCVLGAGLLLTVFSFGVTVSPATALLIEHLAVDTAVAGVLLVLAMFLSRLLARKTDAALARDSTVAALGGAALGWAMPRISVALSNPPTSPVGFGTMWDLFAVGMALYGAGLSALLMTTQKRRAARMGSNEARIAETARSHLQRIRFMQTLTVGSTATVTVGSPVQAGRSRSNALAEHQLTLPQVVHQYRQFATEAAEWWRAKHKGDGRIVIGIDEVDKIGAGPDAERFINDIKAVFGTPHSLYLVAVSEDALAAFEQRAFSIRGSFDTAFDDILQVEHLSFADVQSLLSHRIAGITDPLLALCYVLSGGLPRDCLRVVRAIVEAQAVAMNAGTVAAALAGREVDEAKNVQLRVLNALTPGEADPLLARLLDRAWPAVTAKDLHEVARACAGQPHTREFSAKMLFLATVLEVFVDERPRLLEGLREKPEETAELLSLLARARASASQNLDASTTLVETFRKSWPRPR